MNETAGGVKPRASWLKPIGVFISGLLSGALLIGIATNVEALDRINASTTGRALLDGLCNYVSIFCALTPQTYVYYEEPKNYADPKFDEKIKIILKTSRQGVFVSAETLSQTGKVIAVSAANVRNRPIPDDKYIVDRLGSGECFEYTSRNKVIDVLKDGKSAAWLKGKKANNCDPIP